MAYEPLLDFELQAHIWLFSISRAELSADATAPTWGKDYSYTVPTDFLRFAPPYNEDLDPYRDWQLEGRKILTNDTAPLYLRYVARITDVSAMPPVFREALSARIAYELCEEITQSNTKKDALKSDYIMTLREARRVNALERGPQEFPDGSWIAVRD